MQGDLLKIVLFIACMLIKDEQISVIVQGAEDEALVELTDDAQLLKIVFAEHH